MAREDPVGVVEAAYADAPTDEAWLRRVAEAARPAMDAGSGVCAWTYRVTSPQQVEIANIIGLGCARDVVDMADKMHRVATKDVYDQTYFGSLAFVSGSQSFGQREEFLENRLMKTYAHPIGVVDSLALIARDPSGIGCLFCAALPKVMRPSHAATALWTRVSTHIAAGYRLRSAMGNRGARDVAAGADAVLEPNGKVQHAVGAASLAKSRSSLRDAARGVDRARSSLRHREPHEALELWRALVAGEWTLVDRFDSDGRRFVVARRNAPKPAMTLPALSVRERQVVAYAMLGHANKLIAYELGLSESTISVHLVNALRKLGLRSKVELATLLRS